MLLMKFSFCSMPTNFTSIWLLCQNVTNTKFLAFLLGAILIGFFSLGSLWNILHVIMKQIVLDFYDFWDKKKWRGAKIILFLF